MLVVIITTNAYNQSQRLKQRFGAWLGAGGTAQGFRILAYQALGV